MGQITRDGVTFDSDWIDVSVARFKNKQIPWVVRIHQFDLEIPMREEALKRMLQTTPDDQPGLAAHIDALKQDALKQIEDELRTEPLNPRRS